MKRTDDGAVSHAGPSETGEGDGQATDEAEIQPHVSALASFDRRDFDGCAVVGAAGEIDVSTATAFRYALVQAAARSERLVVDLSEVTFLDCAGLSALATVARRVRGRGETPHVVGVNGIVGRVIALTRLDEVVAIDASVEDALASMTPRAS